MLALTIRPGHPRSTRLEQIPPPNPSASELLVQTLAIGICGTDREIIAGLYGEAPPGDNFLILGHESLGKVVQAPAGCEFSPGDLVVGIVRRPDPVPCSNCAVGEWDMCRNGQYTEHGIKQLHGFCVEYFCIDPKFAVKVDASLVGAGMLIEPASIIAKAWEQIERIGNRANWNPRRVLVTGAGTIGLMAALMGVQRNLEVHVLDRVTSGPKPQLVRSLGANYFVGDVVHACANADIVIECTGVAKIVFDVMKCTAPNGIVCLTGLSSGARELTVNFAALNQSLVLENDVVFGSVNANRRHYEAAARALADTDIRWLEKIVSRREPIERWEAALERRPNDVKTVIEFLTD